MPGTPRYMPSVYVETTVVSFMAARPSRDVLVLGHQELTRQWWKVCRQRCRAFVGPLVLREAARGDADAARGRLALLRDVPILEEMPDITQLTEAIRGVLSLPAKAAPDSVHLAFAVWYEMDYLVTWNCAHLANAQTMRALADYTRREGLWLPILCTPEEMPRD